MKKITLLAFAALLCCSAFSQNFDLVSPSGLVKVQIGAAPNLTWQLFLRDKPLTQPAQLALEVQGMGLLGENVKVLKNDRKAIRTTEMPVVHQKSAEIANNCNEITLSCKGDWGVVFRAYDEGIAYRFFTNFKKDINITGETFRLLPVGENDMVWYPEEEGYMSHNERIYKKYTVREVGDQRLASLPALLATESGPKILVTETDLQNYAGLWLRGMPGNANGLQGVFPAYPKTEVLKNDRDLTVTERENYIAKTKGKRTFPWRVFMLAERDRDLLTNQLPYLLAEPSRVKTTDWIKPGKIAWDWWNNLNVYGPDVTFKAGVNTATYRYFIDFAAENKLEYVVLDEGWSLPSDLMKINPDINMDELAAYAKQKNVGIILWALSVPMEKQMTEALNQFEKWGIKGVKVDFMQRDDQKMVNFYWKMADECAKRKMLCDFHGAYKPSGLNRTYPNVLTSEGVYGLENAKWDKDKKIAPPHNVTLPFIRMAAGPMDYTPGAMLNYQEKDWSPSWNRPASLGTRCHELAKYVIFESPLQMLADSPTNYKKEPECLHFLAKVPAVWEKTIPIDAKVGEYVATARKSADGLWYVGAMTDWSARELPLRFDFLPLGDYELEIFEDGLNADRCAQDYKHTVRTVKSGEIINAKLAPGGGLVGVLRKI